MARHKLDSELTSKQLARRNYMRAWQTAHKEQQKAVHHERYVAHRDDTLAAEHERYQNDSVFREAKKAGAARQRIEHRDDLKDYFRAKKHGCSKEQYTKIYAAQGGRCAVCGAEKAGRFCGAGKAETLCVDHDHETGVIRGLLCGHCNCGLGHMRDNPVLLRRAADYLDRFKQ